MFSRSSSDQINTNSVSIEQTEIQLNSLSNSSSNPMTQSISPFPPAAVNDINPDRLSSVESGTAVNSGKKLVNFTFEDDEMVRQHSINSDNEISGFDSRKSSFAQSGPFNITEIIGNTISRMQTAQVSIPLPMHVYVYDENDVSHHVGLDRSPLCTETQA